MLYYIEGMRKYSGDFESQCDTSTSSVQRNLSFSLVIASLPADLPAMSALSADLPAGRHDRQAMTGDYIIRHCARTVQSNLFHSRKLLN